MTHIRCDENCEFKDSKGSCEAPMVNLIISECGLECLTRRYAQPKKELLRNQDCSHLILPPADDKMHPGC